MAILVPDHPQPGHAVEVLAVAGDEGRAGGEGAGGDQEVHRGDALALAVELGEEGAVAARDLEAGGVDLERGDDPLDPAALVVGAGGAGDPGLELAEDEERDPERLFGELAEPRGGGSALAAPGLAQQVDEEARVEVDQRPTFRAGLSPRRATIRSRASIISSLAASFRSAAARSRPVPPPRSPARMTSENDSPRRLRDLRSS